MTLLLPCISCTKKEKLLIGGAGWPQIAIIDKASGEIEWSHPLTPEEECYDVDMTPDGEILYAFKLGAKLITRSHETVWTYEVNESEALYSATCLESGNYLLGIAGYPARIVELDRNGTPVKELSFQTATPELKRQFRHILKTAQNTYLLPMIDKHKVLEINESGKAINSVYCGGEPVSVAVAENGNWLVTGGDTPYIMEFDPKSHSAVRTVETKDISYGALMYVGELIPYKNGNVLITNWDGRSNEKTQPVLLEIDPDNKVVWRLPFLPKIFNISTADSFFE